MRKLLSTLTLLLPPALLFIALAAWMHREQAQALDSARAAARLNNLSPPRPIAEVASAVAAMKLVTVEIDTTIKVERGDESWRGDVIAAIEAPVRLSFGTDLSKMSVSSLAFSPVTGEYIIRVPRPTIIATQVFPERGVPKVDVGWLRLRSNAGEYYLSQARKDLPAVAQRLQLRPDDALRIESTTREQVEKLVRSIVGDSSHVAVSFLDTEP
ncbi:MAG: DUF4230 domain-containing protein [Planctomycetes bacterium]|nr:DUF4230 domain-containing protein [Planctomycetota bacterium]